MRTLFHIRTLSVSPAVGPGRLSIRRFFVGRWLGTLSFSIISVFTIADLNSEDQSARSDDSTRAELNTVIEKYAAANDEYQQERRKLKTRPERSALRKKLLPPVPDAMRFVHWAEKNAKDAIALEGLLLIINRGPFTPAGETSASVLAKNHLDDKGFRQIVMAIQGTSPPTAEKCLRSYMEKSSVPGTRTTACWALGVYKAQLLSWAQMLDGGPLLAELVDKQMVPHLRTLDREQILVDATSLLRRVMTEYPDVNANLANMAKRDYERVIREFKTLGLGETAPEIESETLLGRDLKLSDYRGKVVVLTFWSTTCIPCMRMIPQEKSLVEKYRKQPFALLGVNTDEDRERAKAAVAKHKMNWPSWWDGEETGSPISKNWGLSFLPTIYVIDHNGIIRYKHLRDEQLVKAVSSLLQEMAEPDQ